MTSLENLILTLAKIPWPRAGCISATVLLLTQYDSSITWNALMRLYSSMSMLVLLPLAAEALRAKICASASVKAGGATLPEPARTRFRPAGLKMGPIVLLLILAMFIPAGTRAASPSLQFNIPAGDALKTMQVFIEQSKVAVMYRVDTLRGVRTNAVAGNLPAREALALMLKGAANVEWTFEEGDALVSITERTESAHDPALVEVAVLPPPAEGAPSSRDRDPEINQVVVTGTLIRGVLDIMSPLELMTTKDMKKSAYSSVQEAMQSFTATSGTGALEDAEDLDNLDRGASANLRGLGADATLVLVNGRRQPLSGARGDFVDLSNIPWSIVERVEVLPDGASALYGSDAIAGVVNVITRTDFEGTQTDARYSAPHGGAKAHTLSQLFGDRWSSGNAVLGYEYSEQSALPAAARYFSANADKGPLGGSDFRSSISGNIFDPITLLPVFGIPSDADGKTLTPEDLASNRINLENQYESFELLPSKRMHSVYVSGEQRVGARIELFGDLRFSRRSMTLGTFAEERVLSVPSTNPNFVSPFSGAHFVLVGYNFGDDLGSSIGRARTSVLAGSIGARADVGDSWRVALTQSDASLRTRYADHNHVDVFQLSAALADSNPDTAFDPFVQDGQPNPAILDAIRSVRAQGSSSRISTTTLLADGTVMQLPTGRLNLALGAESRLERFATGSPLGDRLFRQVSAAFSELALPLLGEGGSSEVPRLDVSLAARWEHYADMGYVANPKIGIRWAPARGLKFRTTWGTSAKAPKLLDQYPSSRNLALLVAMRDPMSPSGTSIVLARVGSNRALSPELATTWTAGVDIQPDFIPRLATSVTYYDIDYTDRVIVPGPENPLDVLMEGQTWERIVDRYPSAAAVDAVCESEEFQGSVWQCQAAPIAAIADFRVRNMSAVRARGFDFSAEQSVDSRYGRFGLGLKGTYVMGFEQQLTSSVQPVDLANTAGYPLRLRMRGMVDWHQRGIDGHGLHASVAATYSGAYTDSESAWSENVGSLTMMDLWLGYRTAQGTYLGDLDLTAGVVNLFNRAPPFLDRPVGYDVVHADPYGRVVVIDLQKTW